MRGAGTNFTVCGGVEGLVVDLVRGSGVRGCAWRGHVCTKKGRTNGTVHCPVTYGMWINFGGRVPPLLFSGQ